jgi:hypothetical protein
MHFAFAVFGRDGRVIDPLVMDAGQDLIESSGNLVKIFVRQFAFVELSIDENIVNELAHQPLNP